MSEYWKSTPSYWCKFCSQYVRDTPVERKNHESSAKHQSNIQRSLRELHKGKEREERDKQRAKDEVNRLNGLVGGQQPAVGPGGGGGAQALSASQDVSRSRPSRPPPSQKVQTTAQQRRAHAEQLAALGVELPEELKKEITGVGSYEVVHAQEVVGSGRRGDVVTVDRSLAEILAEARRGGGGEEEEEEEGSKKRKAGEIEDGDGNGEEREEEEGEEEEGEEEEAAAPRRRKTWGSTVKTYPAHTDDVDVGDLDALLGGVKKRRTKTEDGGAVKQEQDNDTQGVALSAVPDVEGAAAAAASSGHVKLEDGAAVAAAPAVVFKKRRGKK